MERKNFDDNQSYELVSEVPNNPLDLFCRLSSLHREMPRAIMAVVGLHRKNMRRIGWKMPSERAKMQKKPTLR